MTVNFDLLIAAPMLQDLLVDKNGLAMSGGTITLYHDDSRTTLKNWYYQTGTPGTYTFLPLPNPLTLSAAGTITDINGVDTIPFYYPYLESDETIIDKYYITIVNQTQTNQITRANFPYNVDETAAETVGIFNNLIINNGFWRNALPNTVNDASMPQSISMPATVTNGFLKQNIFGNFAAVVAPSQHDGFIMPDIQFIKNNVTASENLTFTAIPLESTLPIKGTNTPEYLLTHNCTTGGTGETLKCYQFPIALHINNLGNLNYTVSIQASSSGSSTIQLNLYQFAGTGAVSPAPMLIQQIPLTLTPTLTQYSLTDIFPPAAGLKLGLGADDAFFLQVSLPMNQVCNVAFTKPSLYLTDNELPVIDFQTYDQVNAIISSPRSGDIRISLNYFGFTNLATPSAVGLGNFGWIEAGDKTIGSTASGASGRANDDTWILYYTLWTNTADAQCPVTGGRSVGLNGAFMDFSANKPIALPKQLNSLIGENSLDDGVPLAQQNKPMFATGSSLIAYTLYNVYFKL